MAKMKHFWTAEGAAALERLVRAKPLIAFDFDGTLAPIVARPDDARVPTAIAARLGQLAARFPVAVVTGRSIADVQPRLGFTPHFIIGNHGAQQSAAAHPGERTRHALDRLRAKLDARADALKGAQIQVEDKGFSVALHYRLAQDRDQAMRVIDKLLQPLDEGLKRFGGKCVENVVPADAPDKGDAVTTLMRETAARSLLFVGDDLNDEAVFERAEPSWLTIRIGNDAMHSRARFFLGSQTELVLLLESLLRPCVSD